MDNQPDPAALADEAGGADPKVDTSDQKSSKARNESSKSGQSKSARGKNSSTVRNGIGQAPTNAESSDSADNAGTDESKPSVFTKQTEKRSDATAPKGIPTPEAGSEPEGTRKPSTPPTHSPAPTPPPTPRSVFTPASVTKPHRFPEADGPVNPDSPFKSVSPGSESPSPQGGDAVPGTAAAQAQDARPATDNPPVGRAPGGSSEDDDQSDTTSTLAAAALARELTGAGFASPGFRSPRVSGSDVTRRAAAPPPPPAGSVFTRATQAPSAPVTPSSQPGSGGSSSASGQVPPVASQSSPSRGSSAAATTNTNWTSPGQATDHVAPPAASASPAAPVSDWKPSSASTQEWTGTFGSGDQGSPDTAGLAAPPGPAYSPPSPAPQGGMPEGYAASTQSAATQAPPAETQERIPSTSAAPGSVRSSDLKSKVAMPFAKPGKKKKSRPSAVRPSGGAVGNGRSAVTVKSKPGPVGSPATPLAPKSGVRQDAVAARDAQLVLSRIEPWSVMKFSFLASLVGFVILLVAVAVLYFFFSALGVFHSIEQTVHLVTTSGGSAGSNAASWFSFGTVMGYTMLAGAIDVVLITALTTVGAVIYNAVSHISGGIEITLQEAD